jgi:hypothetical protein
MVIPPSSSATADAAQVIKTSLTHSSANALKTPTTCGMPTLVIQRHQSISSSSPPSSSAAVAASCDNVRQATPLTNEFTVGSEPKSSFADIYRPVKETARLLVDNCSGSAIENDTRTDVCMSNHHGEDAVVGHIPVISYDNRSVLCNVGGGSRLTDAARTERHQLQTACAGAHSIGETTSFKVTCVKL